MRGNPDLPHGALVRTQGPGKVRTVSIGEARSECPVRNLRKRVSSGREWLAGTEGNPSEPATRTKIVAVTQALRERCAGAEHIKQAYLERDAWHLRK